MMPVPGSPPAEGTGGPPMNDWFDAEKHVERAHELYEAGRWEQAEGMFYMAQQLEPRNAGAFTALAESLLERGQNERAVWCLREAATLDAELPGVQARLAAAYRATGRHERARQLYLRELRIEPGDIDTLLDLGSLLVEMNRFVEAGEKFRRVLEIEPDSADAHFELGDLAERQGQTEAAAVHFDVVLRLDPGYPGARRRLAAIRLHGPVERGAEARELLARELAELREAPREFGPADLEELGRLLLDAGEAPEAVGVLRLLAERKPEEAAARHLLSVALLESGDRAGGVEEARRVLRLDRRFVPAMHNLAMAAVQERQWGRARSWLRRARRVDPGDASLRRLKLALGVHAVVEAANYAVCWLLRRRAR